MDRLDPPTPTNQPASGPASHPGDELLLDYAVGACSPAESLLIALHLEFCARCRGLSDNLMLAGGAMLDAIAPAFVSPQMFNKTLQAIGQDTPPEAQPQIPRVPTFAAGWPAPLRDKVATSHLKRWRWLPAGFRALRVPFPDTQARMWVMKAPSGGGAFIHTHAAEEWTMVLEGGFTDETGTYAAGDFVVAGPTVEHQTVAEEGEGCVCVLLVRSAQLYTTWPGKLLAPFIRL